MNNSKFSGVGNIIMSELERFLYNNKCTKFRVVVNFDREQLEKMINKEKFFHTGTLFNLTDSKGYIGLACVRCNNETYELCTSEKQITMTDEIASVAEHCNDVDFTHVNGRISYDLLMNTVSLASYVNVGDLDVYSISGPYKSWIERMNFGNKNGEHYMVYADRLFYWSVTLKELDMRAVNFRTVVSMVEAFKNCGTLAEINFGETYPESLIKCTNIFSGCKNLKKIIIEPRFLDVILHSNTSYKYKNGYLDIGYGPNVKII